TPIARLGPGRPRSRIGAISKRGGVGDVRSERTTMTVQELKRLKGVETAPIELFDVPPPLLSDDLAQRTERVAAVAALHAEEVDRDGRFPIESITAAKALGLMGLMAPRSLGGEQASLSEIADVCFMLGRACASTAMIYAMHQVKVACVVRHGLGAAWQEDFIRKLVRDQLLLASSTTEGSGGGNVRSSEAPIERDGVDIRLERAASVISYGAEADAVVTTARRNADAAASDQVLAVFLKRDYTLERTLTWDTLGMRGTCSAGFTLRAKGTVDHIVPAPYELIHAQSMVPAAHILWSSAWAGVAAAAVEKARKYLRKAVRGGAELPPSAPYFTRAGASLRALRALVASAAARYEAIKDDPDALMAMDYQSEINLLKVDTSELAVQAVMSALRCGGLSSYRNDSDVSIGRHLRDVLSSPIMINNDRILANVAASALLSEVPATIRG
ncbi:MAG TPA: acyl-CoA dehydrogenase family protein, partial [Caulobacteraceae bacterium]|nr:acyl-CoA dehydrogenase family protein [Caulobacteraceae bacterium]